MTIEELELIKYGLDEYSRRLSNDGCNDIDSKLASLLPPNIRQQIAAENDIETPDGIMGYNWMVVDYLRKRVEATIESLRAAGDKENQ